MLRIHPPFTGSAVVTLFRQRVGSIRTRATSTASMSFSRLLKKYSQPSFTHSAVSAPTGAGGDHSSGDSNKPTRQASEPTPTIPRPWRKKKTSTTDRAQANSSRSSSVLPSTANAEGPISEGKTCETPVPMPLPPTSASSRLTSPWNLHQKRHRRLAPFQTVLPRHGMRPRTVETFPI